MSHTVTMELQEPFGTTTKTLQAPSQAHQRHSFSSSEHRTHSHDGRPVGPADLPAPVPSMAEQEAPKWNSTHSSTFRVCLCFYTLFTMGANDAAYGALILYVRQILAAISTGHDAGVTDVDGSHSSKDTMTYHTLLSHSSSYRLSSATSSQLYRTT